jgi:hypothetical protein
MHGLWDVVFGTIVGGSKFGSEYTKWRKIGNSELGIEKEDIESVTKEVSEGDRHVPKW